MLNTTQQDIISSLTMHRTLLPIARVDFTAEVDKLTARLNAVLATLERAELEHQYRSPKQQQEEKQEEGVPSLESIRLTRLMRPKVLVFKVLL